MNSGVIFNVQGFSIHDGPGIRTTVFLKGCPLRCLWCQNPESQRTQPQVFFETDKCKGCGACVKVCANAAIRIDQGKARTDRDACTGNGACVATCPSGARNLMGRQATAAQMFAEVAADAKFYENSGGGVTLSGGEPLFNPVFAAELLRLCKEAGLHTALDTCGYASWPNVVRVLKYVDLVLFDFKHMNSAQHQRGTGVPNELILQNARKIHHELAIPMLARVPIIPDYNDSVENLRETARFISEDLSPSIPVHLNAYHRLGQAKFERLEVFEAPFSASPPTDTQLSGFKQIFESFGLATVIGG